MPDYLLKIGDRGSQKMIARWRYDNEEERNEFWKTEEEKRCRIRRGGRIYKAHIDSYEAQDRGSHSFR